MYGIQISRPHPLSVASLNMKFTPRTQVIKEREEIHQKSRLSSSSTCISSSISPSKLSPTAEPPSNNDCPAASTSDNPPPINTAIDELSSSDYTPTFSTSSSTKESASSPTLSSEDAISKNTSTYSPSIPTQSTNLSKEEVSSTTYPLTNGNGNQESSTQSIPTQSTKEISSTTDQTNGANRVSLSPTGGEDAHSSHQRPAKRSRSSSAQSSLESSLHHHATTTRPSTTLPLQLLPNTTSPVGKSCGPFGDKDDELYLCDQLVFAKGSIGFVYGPNGDGTYDVDLEGWGRLTLDKSEIIFGIGHDTLAASTAVANLPSIKFHTFYPPTPKELLDEHSVFWGEGPCKVVADNVQLIESLYAGTSVEVDVDFPSITISGPTTAEVDSALELCKQMAKQRLSSIQVRDSIEQVATSILETATAKYIEYHSQNSAEDADEMLMEFLVDECQTEMEAHTLYEAVVGSTEQQSPKPAVKHPSKVKKDKSTSPASKPAPKECLSADEQAYCGPPPENWKEHP